MKIRFLLLAATALPALNVRGEEPPANLGRGLRELVAWHQAQPATDTVAVRKSRLEAQFKSVAKAVVANGSTERAIVNVKLNGAQSVAAIRPQLEALGLEITATNEVAGPGSTLTVRLPLERAVEVSKLSGVYSLALVHPPIRRVGKATSQGAGVLHSDAVNALGYDGTGITVGVLSDSYDQVTPHAAADILADDLPGAGNPAGHTQPVHVLAEGPSDGSDEGRGMLQIVHDIAPGARLAFAGVGDSQESFATRIRAMRTDPAAGCDVLVDDISFPDEPFFSDGPVAQAVDDVVHSSVLLGRKVLFYSAAGNDGGAGYADDFRFVSDASARAGAAVKDNLKLAQVPTRLTDGGFHNFDPRPGKVRIAQTVTLSGGDATVTFQWDDPFVPGLVTTDYNVLVFDAAGNYLTTIDGGIDVNVPGPNSPGATGDPLEIFDLPLATDGSDTVYQLAITRRNVGAQTANHFRYVASTNGSFDAEFAAYQTPTIYGHTAAPGADGVAAYEYRALDEPETFTSPGPVTIYFDRNGARLPDPEIRQQPTIAAPDNVDTSFFPTGAGQDKDGDGLPNFLGTSAAAPHAAGVAALLLQAAGGPGKLTDEQVRALLESTARPHDLDPGFSQAVITTDDGSTATLEAVGDASNNSAFDKTFFRLTFADGANRRLQKATIDLGPAGLKFDQSADLGFPFTVGKPHGIRGITGLFSGDDSMLTVKFPAGALAPGVTVEFGVDRDDATTGDSGNAADLLAGATVKIKTKAEEGGGAVKATGTFVNSIGAGYSPVDGFGLIDAQAAINQLLGK